jgi:hypothetical protein
MTTFAPKIYQQKVLDNIEAYFNTCYELPSPPPPSEVGTARSGELPIYQKQQYPERIAA